MKKTLLLVFALLFSIGMSAQCEDFVEGPWVNFNTLFGGSETGPGVSAEAGVTNEITTFEVWASEAYIINGFVQGNEYTFSICNGAGAGSWTPDFAVLSIDEDDNVELEAWGLDDDSTCSITWVAAQSGTYLIVLNEEGNCGVANIIDNGFPAITNNGTASVDNHLASSFSVYPNPVKDVLNISNSINAEINAVIVTDINGRTVKQTNANVSEINISDLNAGVYFVNINSTEGSLTKKVVKQ